MSAPGAPGTADGGSSGTADRGFALFADCLLVGVLVALASVPLMTAYPALVAGCALVRERVFDDRSVGGGRYWRRLREVLASGPVGLLVPLLVVGVLLLDAGVVASEGRCSARRSGWCSPSPPRWRPFSR